MPTQLLNFWQPNTVYPQGTFIFDGIGDVQQATIGGVSGLFAPNWNSQSHIGGSPPAPIFTTQDGSVTWTLVGLGSKVVALQRLQDPIGPYDQRLNDAVSVSRGGIDAGKFAVLNAAGLIDSSMGGMDGGGSVSSFNGRTGVVIPQAGDYSYAEISGTPTPPQNTPAITHEFLTSYNSTTGAFGQAQPSFGDISGTITVPGQIGASGSPSATTFLRGDATWASAVQTLKTNNALNSSQTLLDLFSGAGIGLTDGGSGTINIFNTGVLSLNGETGNLTIAGANSVTVLLSGSPPSIITVVGPLFETNGTPNTNQTVLSINQSTGISVSNPSDGIVAISNTGVISITSNGVSPISGTVNLVAGTGITLTPAGQNITIASTGGGGGGGGVNERSASYTAVSGDLGKTIVFNTLSNVTLTLPNPPPSTTWWIYVQNINTGIVDISGNGLLIDNSFDTFGSPPISALPLMQNEGVYITTDGTNYFTERGLSNGGVNAQTSNYTAQGSDDGKLISFSSSGNLVLTLPAVPPSTDWEIDVEDVGPGSLTINPNGLLLDGSPNNLILSPASSSTAAPSTDTYVLGTPDTVNLPNSVANPGLYFGSDNQPTIAGSLDDEFNEGAFDLTRWTWVNQGTASVVVANSLLTLQSQAENANNIHQIYQPAPATPWTVIVKLNALDTSNYVEFMGTGLSLSDASGKFVNFAFSVQSASGAVITDLSVDNWNSTSSFQSNSFVGSIVGSFPVWLKIQDNGTNLIFSVSHTGSQYLQCVSVSRTNWLAAGPTRVGLYINQGAANVAANGVYDYFRRTQ